MPDGSVFDQDDALAIAMNAFSEVLGREVEDPDLDFFALGGSSLHAYALLGRLAEETKTAVSIESFVKSPTPAGLAAHLTRAVRP